MQTDHDINQGYEWTFKALYVKVNALITWRDWMLLNYFKTTCFFPIYPGNMRDRVQVGPFEAADPLHAAASCPLHGGEAGRYLVYLR
jgi:hypothetical protein